MGNYALLYWYESYGNYVHDNLRDGWFDLITTIAYLNHGDEIPLPIPD
jgi:hypothetical protein